MDRNALLVAGAASLAAVGLWCLTRRRGGQRTVSYQEVGALPPSTGTAPPGVLVTGGTGFVGRCVLKHLAAGGGAGRRTIISFDSRAPPEGERVEGVLYVVGSLVEQGHLQRAMAGRGVRAVLHVAGIKSFVGTRLQDLLAVNVEGTRRVIAACKEMGVRSLVYTSSLTVALDASPSAPPARNVNMTRDAPHTHTPLDDYAKSKMAAEKLVLEANGAGLETVSLRPTAIYGPGDNAIFDQIKETFNTPTFGEAQHAWDWVSVSDVARAHVCALEALEQKRPEVAGHAFFVGQGETAVYRDVFMSIGNLIHMEGQQCPSIPIPLAKVLARINVFIHSLTGLIAFHVSMTVASINFTQVNWSVDITPTTKYLGYTPEHPTTPKTIRAMVKGQGLLLKGK